MAPDYKQMFAQEYAAVVKKMVKLRLALAEIAEIADDHADADCTGDPPRFIPNDWMRVQTIADCALKINAD